MGAAKKLIDKKALRNLVPINALSAPHLEEISRKAVIEEVRSNTYVFKKGDSDNQTVYLLDGKIELVDEKRVVVDVVTSDSEEALHPLAHKQPRQLGVRAVGKVTVARIASSLLDVLLTWDESAGYDVVEIDAQDDDDWMTRMLQSQAFLQLPPSNIHQLLMRLEAVGVEPGETIVRQGDEGDYFYIVKSGRLAVTRRASPTSQEVLLAELGEGACFGEEALVSGTKRNASVMMITAGTLMRLSKDDFNELLCAPLVHEADFESARKLVKKGASLLDVRLPGEFENQAIEGSINLPLSALREQCLELDSGTDYIVCCDTGRRSAAGAFILSQRGFSVYTLKNGLMDVPEEALTRRPGTRSAAAATNADIIQLANEKHPESGLSAGDIAAQSRDTSADDSVLIDKLAAAENDKLALERKLKQHQAKLDDAQTRAEAAEARVKEYRSDLDSLRNEVETMAAARDGLESSHQRLCAVEEQKASLEAELARVQAALSELQHSAEERDDALHRELEQMAGQLQTEQQNAEHQSRDLEEELAGLRDEYERLGQRTSAAIAERDAATRELRDLQQQLAGARDKSDQEQSENRAALDSLQRTLNEREQALESERTESRQLTQRLEEAEDARRQLEEQLTAVSEQAGAGQSQTAELQARLQQRDQEQAASREELDSLQRTLNEREQALESERTESRQLTQRLEEAEGARRQLEEQLTAVSEQADAGQSQTAELQTRLDEREQQHKSFEAAVQSANQQVEALQEQLEQAQQQLDEQLRQRSQSDGEAERLNQRIVELQERLDKTSGETGAERDALAQRVEQLQQELKEHQNARQQFEQERDTAGAAKQELDHELEELRQSLTEHQLRSQNEEEQREALEQQLAAVQQQLSDRAEREQKLEEELQGLRAQEAARSSELQQQADEAEVGRASIEAELAQVLQQLEESRQRNTDLETRSVSLASEFRSDLASAREAMSRAQTETENVQRENSRILKSLQKAERKLENERQDHESELHRLRRQLKEAAGESSTGLATELEAMQSKLQESSRTQEDLEIRLGERSAQLEDVLARTQKLETQLRQATETAGQAEQQLLEANRSANEEMAVRIEAEEKAQQALRAELAAVIAERNQSRERLTIQVQELDELRAAIEAVRQQDAEQDQARQDTLLQAQQERDQALVAQQELQQQVDQLRAEAEVTRGLVAMQSPVVADAALREELEQAKKNVDVAVRLRRQAEEQNAALQADMERLRARAQEAGEAAAGQIPSLDEGDPQAATALNPFYADTETETTVSPQPGVLVDDDDASVAEPAVPTAVAEQAPIAGRLKGLLGVVVIGAVVAGATAWWLHRQPPSDQLSEVQEHQAAVPPAVVDSDDEGVRGTAAPEKQSAQDQRRPAIPETRSNGRGEAVAAQAELPRAAGDPATPAPAYPDEIPDFSKGSSKAAGQPDDERWPDIDAMPASDTEPPASDSGVAVPPREPVKAQPVRSYSDALSGGGRAPVMAEFQSDSYDMGSPPSSAHFDERPQHRVRLGRFSISKHEVTFDDYDQFALATGRRLPADKGWGRATRPVVNVRWEDAVAYTQWLSEQTGGRYRLPTEAEWEFAARSGSTSRFWWGNETDAERANCFDCGTRWSGAKTAPVGSFPASPFGVYDMAGNVMEWVQDCYQSDYSAAPDDGSPVSSGDCSRRVVRGGGYNSPSENLRSASRDAHRADARLDNLGFRVVKE